MSNKDRPFDPGLLIVISGPSGAGKSTLCRGAMKRLSHLEFSISYTTRTPRGSEVPGKDYFFIDDVTFDRMIAEDAFLEWAAVHENRYGTSREFVQSRTREGAHLILDIDTQGAAQLRKTHPDSIFVFCVAPSAKSLENRLRGRGTDQPDVIERRLQNARGEIRQAVWYDYLVVNDIFEQALEQFVSIIVAEGCRRSRSPLRLERLMADYGIQDLHDQII